jgi:membrane associated rhomboid family serine protease
MKSNNSFIGLAIMFFAIAVALALTVWGEVSWAAKIGMFCFGLASGILAGRWLAKRS